jgi:multidrug efflux pump subunit AcrB
VTVGDVGRAEDGHQIQNNIVTVDGQPSVYLPVMKQGGDTNTIAVVDGVKELVGRLNDVPKELVLGSCRSVAVREAGDRDAARRGGIGLALTALMVLVFLGSFRATVAVFLSIPLSVLAAIIALYMGGSSINTMILAGSRWCSRA